MILLEKENYYKVTEALSKVQINNLFARSVIENCVTGTVYVDNKEEPKAFYLVHPYGLSLLFGAYNNIDFNNSFKYYALNTNNKRDKHEWMQVYPEAWNTVVSDLFKDSLIKVSENIEKKERGIIELNSRVNFKFNPNKYLKFKKEFIVADYQIVRTDRQIFRDMKGSVTPFAFWDNADDFCNNGVGFSLFHEGKLASTAYTAFIHDDMLEIGIETVEAFRGKGFAQYTCSSLIDYCIENKYEPIWSCKFENTNSYNLAQKIGFEVAAKRPYYRLSK